MVYSPNEASLRKGSLFMDTMLDVKNASRPMLRYSFWIIFMLVAAFTFRDYWDYSMTQRLDPPVWDKLAEGIGDAPAQYRVAIIDTAALLIKLTHGHLSYRHFFALFDFITSLCSCLLIRGILLRTPSFLQADKLSQYLRLALLLGLTLYYLYWSLWYQRPETWASALYIALSLYLLSSVRSPGLVFFGLIGLSIVQAFVRADVAILFHFALFLYVLLRGGSGFLVGKGVLLPASILSGLLSTTILWVLIHKIFPNAVYGGDKKVFELLTNLSPTQFVPFLIFIVPTVYTYLNDKAQGAIGAGPGWTLLLASVFYLISWVMVGRAQEVRIFIPYAFALMPQTINALARRMERS